ncbi:hypothetical protein L2E82_44159 [Cichorium intybus]|uniref:Uncharacterized protein n=1 Tax=Cichorium intybus TaxID=13427 RepID=A0ACB8ZQ57_CICIN|nr:hypothetical protein L2E82_44159 [Cichorium intybus]
MASNHHHHHQCHCQPPNATPPTTTCHCTMCYTTTHYSSPPPPPPDPLIHCVSSHLHHHPPQNHLHAPPQNHHNVHTQHYDYSPPPPPPQIHQKHQLVQKYRQQENAQENPASIDSTVSSLIQRIAALESSLRRRKQSPRSSSLRDAAARTIQTHFRAFLVRRSVTLRHLKDLAYIKSALNKLKSSVSNKSHFDFYLVSRESMNLLIKLDSIQGSDPMIRDGKRSISRELIRFMELIDEISTESRVISVKNIRLSKDGNQSVILQREHKTRASGSRALGDGNDERKIYENLKNQTKKSNRVSSIPKVEEEKFESENPRKHGVSQDRIGALLKSQLKAKKNVSFDEKGNVYRIINTKHSPVSSDESESSNGDDEQVEEIGVSSKEPEVEEEDSSEMSENEMDPRKNLRTRTDHTTNKNHPDEEGEEDEDEEEEEEEDDDSFVFSAPLPAKMEYRVDSVNKKQSVKR